MRSVHGTAGPNDSVRSHSYSHSPYTRLMASEDASPPYPIDQFGNNTRSMSFSQCSSPHPSTYANPKAATPGPADAEAMWSPMARGGSVPIQVTGPFRVHPRLRRSAQSPQVAGSNCSENGHGGLLSSFQTPPLSGGGPGLHSSRAPDEAPGFVGSFGNGEPAPGSWHSVRPVGPRVGSAPVYDHDEPGRVVEASMAPIHHYDLQAPQPNTYGYPPPPPLSQGHSYAPSGFIAPNPVSSPTRVAGSPTLSSHQGWWAGNSVHSESEFPAAPSNGSPTHLRIAAMSHRNSYYARSFSAQSGTLQQAVGHGAVCTGGMGSEGPPVSASEDVTTPMGVGRKGKFPEETDACSSRSGSTVGSVRDDLPLCPEDELCPQINNRRHQRKFTHTCRLFPCYHGHVVRHARLFRHVEGQVAQTMGFDASRMSVNTLASVNFSQISLEAPNAYRIYVSHGDKSHEIFGDWASVKVHTFKRYLHQVYHIAPSSQRLVLVRTGRVLDDEIATVKSYNVDEDSVLQLEDSSRTLDHQACRIPFDEL